MDSWHVVDVTDVLEGLKPIDALVIDVDASDPDFGPNVQKVFAQARSPELEKDVTEHYFLSGNPLITDGYGLPAKHLIFVAGNFGKKNEGELYTSAEEVNITCSDILKLCLKSNFLSVRVTPLFGYETDPIVRDMIAERDLTVCSSFEKEHHGKIAIEFAVILPFEAARSDENDNFDQIFPQVLERKRLFARIHHRVKSNNSENDVGFIQNPGIVCESECLVVEPKEKKRPKNLPPISETFADREYEKPPYVEYVGRYLDRESQFDPRAEEELNNRWRLYLGEGDTVRGSKAINKYSGEQRPPVEKIFMTALALKMNLEEAMDLFTFCGYSLSPVLRKEKFFKYCIVNQMYLDPMQINNAYFAQFHKALFSD
jgi:hypothetical protein